MLFVCMYASPCLSFCTIFTEDKILCDSTKRDYGCCRYVGSDALRTALQQASASTVADLPFLPVIYKCRRTLWQQFSTDHITS